MSAQEWAAFILTLLSISGIVLGGIRWYVKTQTDPVKESVAEIKDVVKEIKAETKTNGGSSMRDEIKSIKKEQEEAKEKRKTQSEKIDHLYDLFVEYVARNSK
jgi:hypothetical protein